MYRSLQANAAAIAATFLLGTVAPVLAQTSAIDGQQVRRVYLGSDGPDNYYQLACPGGTTTVLVERLEQAEEGIPKALLCYHAPGAAERTCSSTVGLFETVAAACTASDAQPQ